ncbi:MAG: ribosome maturation factor RimM [Acidimicrobiia bacterium]
MTEPRLLEIGRVVKAHGVRGEVVVNLVTDRLERLAPGNELVTDQHGRLRVEASRRHQHRWIVRFAHVVDRAAAEALHGVVLRAERLADHGDGELWVHEVIGAAVTTAAGEPCGMIEAVQANPASDLLVLDTGALVPVAFVVARGEDGTVVIDPPDGLLEL